MTKYTREELEAAKKALGSSFRKIEKVRETLSRKPTRRSLIVPVGDGFGFIRFVIRFARTMRLVYLDIIPTFEYNKHEKLMKPVGVSFVMDFMTTKQAGELWGISQRRVSILCEQGRINGVKKAGIMWLIPPDTKKPDDGRLKSERAKRGKSK